MKKKKLQPEQPNYTQWKKEFLFDMFEAYNNEPDINKREAIRQCIREYWLSNPMICYDNNEEEEKLVTFFRLEKDDWMKKLERFKINLDDLAIVSVKTFFNEALHPYVGVAFVQSLIEYDKIIDHNFDKGEIWEYAVLSKDRKSFVLLRDFFDKKIQPIENCFVYKQSTVGKMIKENNCDKKHLCPEVTIYRLKGLDNLKSLDYDITDFYSREVDFGVIGAEKLFMENFTVYMDQINKKMDERQKKIEKKQDKLKNEYTDRETFEF